MSSYQKGVNEHHVESLPTLNEATPPLCPAPMPRQTLVYWTPRLALAALLNATTNLWRPKGAVQRAAVSVETNEEPR